MPWHRCISKLEQAISRLKRAKFYHGPRRDKGPVGKRPHELAIGNVGGKAKHPWIDNEEAGERDTRAKYCATLSERLWSEGIDIEGGTEFIDPKVKHNACDRRDSLRVIALVSIQELA